MNIDNHAYDVIIIGAGPAGCMAAIQAPPEMKLLLIDARRLPRDVICGGVLSNWTMRILDQCGPAPEDIFCHPRKIGWSLYDWKTGKVAGIRDTYFFNADRVKFDAWLLDRVRARGNVDIMSGVRFRSLRSSAGGKRFYVELSGDGKVYSVETKFVIGADGPSSSVRNYLVDGRSTDYWITIQEKILNEGNLVDRFLGVIDEGIDFYGWIIPKGNEVLIGAGFDRKKGQPLDRFRQFRHELRRRHQIDGPVLEKERARAATRLRSLRELNAGSGNIMLAGEAAGLICPWSGEGIAYALYSGGAAGLALADPQPQRAYRRALRQRLPRIFGDILGRKIMKSSVGRLTAAKLFPPAYYDPMP